VEVIRIEGVWFKVEDAREFAERALIYDLINDPQPAGAAEGLAFTIQRCISDDFDATLHEQEKVAVFAVLDEWLQSRDAPDAARTLYNALRSQRSANRRQREDMPEVETAASNETCTGCGRSPQVGETGGSCTTISGRL
jgi:hypothetical protein